MKIDFAINYGTKSAYSIKGKLDLKVLQEVERCLDEAIELLKKNNVDSITMCCTLEVEQEEN